MPKTSNKIEFLTEAYLRDLEPDDELSFLLAICYMRKGNFYEALRLFGVSVERMFSPPFLWWKGTGQVNWLVDVWILSGKEDLYPQVTFELEQYKKTPYGGDSAVACYAYSLMELLSPSDRDISKLIEGVLRRQTWKLTYAIGHVLQAIVKGDANELNSNLVNLLRVHDGMAKRGNLRATAEGLICMQAMSLAYVARKYDLPVRVENEYMPLNYLDLAYKVMGNNLLVTNKGA